MQLQQEFFNLSLSGIQDSTVELYIKNSTCVSLALLYNLE